MKWESVISKIADLAATMDAAGHNDAAIELDDLLFRSTEQLSAAPLAPAAATLAGIDTVVPTNSGTVVVASEQDALLACQAGTAQRDDFVKAASEKAYRLKDISKMAELKSSKDSFRIAVEYLVSL